MIGGLNGETNVTVTRRRAMAGWMMRRSVCVLALSLLAGCVRPSPPPPLEPLPAVGYGAGEASPRVNGDIGSTTSLGRETVSYGTGVAAEDGGGAQSAPGAGAGINDGGGATLNFEDADIRDVVAQILGGILHVNYTIDPAVHGTATLHSSVPITNDQMIPTLQVLLAQAGATLLTTGPLYRIVPAAGVQPAGLASSPTDGGGQVIPLQYASAEDLAKILQPFVTQGSRLAAVAGSNALVISGDPTSREALDGLISALDVDSLSGQFAGATAGRGTATRKTWRPPCSRRWVAGAARLPGSRPRPAVAAPRRSSPWNGSTPCSSRPPSRGPLPRRSESSP